MKKSNFKFMAKILNTFYKLFFIRIKTPNNIDKYEVTEIYKDGYL